MTVRFDPLRAPVLPADLGSPGVTVGNSSRLVTDR